MNDLHFYIRIFYARYFVLIALFVIPTMTFMIVQQIPQALAQGYGATSLLITFTGDISQIEEGAQINVLNKGTGDFVKVHTLEGYDPTQVAKVNLNQPWPVGTDYIVCVGQKESDRLITCQEYNIAGTGERQIEFYLSPTSNSGTTTNNNQPFSPGVQSPSLPTTPGQVPELEYQPPDKTLGPNLYTEEGENSYQGSQDGYSKGYDDGYNNRGYYSWAPSYSENTAYNTAYSNGYASGYNAGQMDAYSDQEAQEEVTEPEPPPEEESSFYDDPPEEEPSFYDDPPEEEPGFYD